ncbi:MAG TPA: SpoIIE family protein phosphatase, partial [Blastocatellia bacterium]|nr:SpoIIE family protein phosphatase [Blastocatellia bacterium]
LALPGDGVVAARLRQSPRPLVVEYREPKSLSLLPDVFPTGTGAAQQQERAVLNRIHSTLLVPIAFKDQLLGVVSLGPRLGDLPYSREDRQLLMAIAWQTAFAVQNLMLVQQIAEEERLRHELEIATSVQQRLFPQGPPPAERLDLWGVCHPARGVGGDYYDFIQLDQGNVGIAVADVAGKGISAALLMSTVQASLRSQAPSVNGRLTELVSSMNRLLYSSTDTNSYATFFFAQFDEKTGRLCYVNAGHNPPILLRSTAAFRKQGAGQAVVGYGDAKTVPAGIGVGAEDAGIIRLTTGGLVIGVFHPCHYEQATIETRPGDVLVAYTDGVTEAINAQGEEFGEGRLQGIIEASAHLSAREISDGIVQAVRQWCGDTPQQDDLTLVVMKVK